MPVRWVPDDFHKTHLKHIFSPVTTYDFVTIARPHEYLQTLKRISKDFSPEVDISARNMNKEEFPGKYPYRDYGLKYWDATHTWVKEYLDVSLRRTLAPLVLHCRGSSALTPGNRRGPREKEARSVNYVWFLAATFHPSWSDIFSIARLLVCPRRN